MQIEKIVGLNMRDRRVALELTQAELGEKLRFYLGKPWSRQAVSLAEAGQRAFTAAELVSLAHILQLRGPGSLLIPAPGVKIDVGDGARIRYWAGSRLGRSSTPEDESLQDDTRESIRREVRQELIETLKRSLQEAVQEHEIPYQSRSEDRDHYAG